MFNLASASVEDTMLEVEDFLCNIKVSFVEQRYDGVKNNICDILFVLSEDKYAPGDTSRWKHVSARFPALYQALLDEPDKAVRKSMYGIAVKRAG